MSACTDDSSARSDLCASTGVRRPAAAAASLAASRASDLALPSEILAALAEDSAWSRERAARSATVAAYSGSPAPRTPWMPGADLPPPCLALTTAQTPRTPVPVGPRPAPSHLPPARTRRRPSSHVRRRPVRISPRPTSSHRRTRPLPPIPSGTPPMMRGCEWPPSTTWHRRPPPTARPHRPVPLPSAAAPPRGAFMPFHPPHAWPPVSITCRAGTQRPPAGPHPWPLPTPPRPLARRAEPRRAALPHRPHLRPRSRTAACRLPPGRAALLASSALPGHLARSRSALARIPACLSAHAALPPGRAPLPARRAALSTHMHAPFGPPLRQCQPSSPACLPPARGAPLAAPAPPRHLLVPVEQELEPVHVSPERLAPVQPVDPPVLRPVGPAQVARHRIGVVQVGQRRSRVPRARIQHVPRAVAGYMREIDGAERVAAVSESDTVPAEA